MTARRYYLPAVPVEAVQYLPDGSNAEAVADFAKGWITGDDVEWLPTFGDYTVRAHPGQWVVRLPDGSIRVQDDEPLYVEEIHTERWGIVRKGARVSYQLSDGSMTPWRELLTTDGGSDA